MLLKKYDILVTSYLKLFIVNKIIHTFFQQQTKAKLFNKANNPNANQQMLGYIFDY